MPQTPPQTLDTKLESPLVESLLVESPLLYKGNDRTSVFLHDTYRDFFIAKYFAEEINSGRMSVKDAYVNYWSYVEDKKLWGLEALDDEDCRALLPAWKNIFPFLVEQLNYDKIHELTRYISKNYLHALEKLSDGVYNPFEEDIYFLVELAANITDEQIIFKLPTIHSADDKELNVHLHTEKELSQLINDLKGDEPAIVVSAATELVRLGCFVPGLSRLLYSNNEEEVIAGIEAFGEFGIFHKQLDYLLDNESVRPYVIDALAQIRHYDPIFREYLNADVDDKTIIAAVNALVKFDIFDERFFDLINTSYEYRDFYCDVINAFKKIKGYEPTLEIGSYGDVMAMRFDDQEYSERETHDLTISLINYNILKGVFDQKLYSYLRSSSPSVVCASLFAFGEARHYDIVLNELLRHKSKKVRRAAADTLAKIIIYGHNTTRDESIRITNTIVRQTLIDLMERYILGFKNDVIYAIKKIHFHIKPKAYNPSVKKLGV